MGNDGWPSINMIVIVRYYAQLLIACYPPDIHHRSMKRLRQAVRRFIKNTQGQDLIEYALMAGFVAVAAGAIMPHVATSISTIFSKVASTMTQAASQS
jgi:pilus assembly protein Flp/PilA